MQNLEKNFNLFLYYLFIHFLALVVASCDIDPEITPTSMPHWFTLFVFQVSVISYIALCM